MRWIPVSKELPKENERVLLFVINKPDDGEYLICCGSKFTCRNVPSGFHLDDDSVEDMIGDDREITHWMPLPSRPAY